MDFIQEELQRARKRLQELKEKPAKDSIQATVAMFCRKHHKEFGAVAVSVSMRREGIFTVEIKSIPTRDVFCGPERTLLREFFTGVFKESMQHEMKDRLGWKAIRVTTNARDRCVSCVTWQIEHVSAATRTSFSQVPIHQEPATL